MSITHNGYREPGIGLISVGWMGELHSRAYQAIPLVYPELKIRPRFVHAADTAADRAEYARDVLGYERVSTDDLKVIEAKKFLVAVSGGEQRNSTIAEALADAEVIAAAAVSARDGAWHSVASVPGATFGHA